MKLREVYDRIGIYKAIMPIRKYLANNSDYLNLVEIWDGGPMEGHLLVQKDDGGRYILYEVIHHYNSKSETVNKFAIRRTCNIQSIINEIEVFCKIRYEGTMNLNFAKMMQVECVRIFFGC